MEDLGRKSSNLSRVGGVWTDCSFVWAEDGSGEDSFGGV